MNKTVKNADMPAMPLPLGTETEKWCQGLTKREMMAMHIASGFAADKEVSPCNIANMAIEVTDALLAELGRTK